MVEEKRSVSPFGERDSLEIDPPWTVVVVSCTRFPPVLSIARSSVPLAAMRPPFPDRRMSWSPGLTWVTGPPVEAIR
jgi:hypothetical protein